ncbi:MAG: flagellar hook-length control protein FliK [Bdellovibrionales bacterium]
MVQVVGTSEVTSKDSILGFLASLKSDANTGNGGGGLFASLLAETKQMPVEVKMPERSVAIERPSLQQTTSSGAGQGSSRLETKTQSTVDAAQEKAEPAKNARQTDEGEASSEAQDAVALKDRNEKPKEAQENKGSSQDKADAKSGDEVEGDESLTQAEEEFASNDESIEESNDSDKALLAFLASLNPLAETKETSDGDTKEAAGDEQLENVDDVAAYIESEIKSLLKRKTKETKGSEEGDVAIKGGNASLEGAFGIRAKQALPQEEVKAGDGHEADPDTGASFDTVLEKAGTSAQNEFSYAGESETSSEEGEFVAEAVTTKKATTKEATNHLVADTAGTNLKKAIESLTSSSSNAQNGSISETGQTGSVQGLQSAARYTQTSQLSTVRTASASYTSASSPAEQIAVQISKMAKEGQEEMTLHLKPEELGKVQVKLEFTGDHKVQATVSADSQASLDLLMKDQDSLQRALEAAGFSLDAGGMQFSLNENNQGQSFKEQQMTENNRFSSGFADDDGGSESLVQETYYVTPERVNLHV